MSQLPKEKLKDIDLIEKIEELFNIDISHIIYKDLDTFEEHEVRTIYDEDTQS